MLNTKNIENYCESYNIKNIKGINKYNHIQHKLHIKYTKFGLPKDTIVNILITLLISFINNYQHNFDKLLS